MGINTRIMFQKPVEAQFLVLDPKPIMDARIIDEPRGLTYWLIGLPTPVIDISTVLDYDNQFETHVFRMGEGRKRGEFELASPDFVSVMVSGDAKLVTFTEKVGKPEDAVKANLGLANTIKQLFAENNPRIAGTWYYDELAPYGRTTK